jgi:hypothetical protein
MESREARPNRMPDDPFDADFIPDLPHGIPEISIVTDPVRRSRRFVACSLALALAPALAAAQQSPPIWGDFSFTGSLAQDQPGKVLTPPPAGSQAPPKDVFQVQQVEVRPGEYREELPVGTYGQPLWTTFRRFPTTRVYLQTPEGGAQFEQWVEIRKPKGTNGGDTTRLRQELEFGLGNRMQFDVYLREEHVRDGVNSTMEWQGTSFELRYALADWDEIWGNPTLYFEYIFNDDSHGGADAIEPKILFGGEIAAGWHWGANLIHERSLAGYNDRTEEYSVTASVSRTIVDQFFSAGATGSIVYASEPGSPHREYAGEAYLGPSFQLIPHPRAAFTFEPLWGCTNESKRMKIFLVFSWHF